MVVTLYGQDQPGTLKHTKSTTKHGSHPTCAKMAWESKEHKNDNNTWHSPYVCKAGMGLLRAQNSKKYMAVTQMRKTGLKL